MRNGDRGKRKVLHSSTGFWRIVTWTEIWSVTQTSPWVHGTVSDIGLDHGASICMDRGTSQWDSAGKLFPAERTIVWLQSQLPSISTSYTGSPPVPAVSRAGHWQHQHLVIKTLLQTFQWHQQQHPQICPPASQDLGELSYFSNHLCPTAQVIKSRAHRRKISNVTNCWIPSK